MVQTQRAPQQTALEKFQGVEPPFDPKVERTFLEGRIEPGAYDEVLINGDAAVPGIKSLYPFFERLIEEEDR